MVGLIFPLSSLEAAHRARHELVRNGIPDALVRIHDHSSIQPVLDRSISPQWRVEVERVVGEGRVLLEVDVDEENQAAIERLMRMVDREALRLVVPPSDAPPEARPAEPAVSTVSTETLTPAAAIASSATPPPAAEIAPVEVLPIAAMAPPDSGPPGQAPA